MFLFLFPSKAMRWIKEVEMVDSEDDLISSRSIKGHRFLNFEKLEAKNASSLKKNHPELKKRINLTEHKAELDDRVLRRRQIAFMICEYFWVTDTHDYPDLYEQEIEHHLSEPNYQKLKSMVKRCMGKKIRVRNFEARSERIEQEYW